MKYLLSLMNRLFQPEYIQNKPPNQILCGFKLTVKSSFFNFHALVRQQKELFDKYTVNYKMKELNLSFTRASFALKNIYFNKTYSSIVVCT